MKKNKKVLDAPVAFYAYIVHDFLLTLIIK